MSFEMRRIPVFVRLALIGGIIAAPLGLIPMKVHAQALESGRLYTPSGRAFNPNTDGSRVVVGSRTEIEKRADVYEAENYRRQLEQQAQSERFNHFNSHDFHRQAGAFNR